MNNYEEKNSVLSRMHDYIYDILCDIDAFCKEQGITYFLSGGTCLGAVRHQDFIPWDDDADLMMPRKDYERFLNLFNQQFAEKYRTLSLYTDESWSRAPSRIYNKNTRIQQLYMNEGELGIFVDVIPIDGLPKGRLRQYYLENKVRVIAALRNNRMRTKIIPGEPHYWLKRMIHRFVRGIDPRKAALYLDKLMKKYEFESSEYVGATLACHYGSKEIIKKEYMDREIRIPFRDKLFPVPVGYDQYLRNLYGDYLRMPKNAEQNGSTHYAGWQVEFDISNKEE